MFGFSHITVNNVHWFYHSKLGFTLKAFNDGSAIFTCASDNAVNFPVPTVSELNLGALPNPEKWDNIRHDLMHIFYEWYVRNTLSPNTEKLLGLANTPLAKCHWEEYKVESLEIFVKTNEKRFDYISDDCYNDAKIFTDWMLACLKGKR